LTNTLVVFDLVNLNDGLISIVQADGMPAESQSFS